MDAQGRVGEAAQDEFVGTARAAGEGTSATPNPAAA